MKTWLTLGLLMLGVASCTPRPKTPNDTLDAYLKAVLNKDARAAYAMLGAPIKEQFSSEAAFVTFFNESYPEIVEEALRLQSQKNTLYQEATLPLEGGAQALLYKTAQGWVVAEESALPDASTLEGALAGLALLLRREASAGPLGYYLSAEAREERRARLLALATLLEQVGSSNIERKEPDALVRLSDGRSLRFRLERGQWCLLSLPEELLF